MLGGYSTAAEAELVYLGSTKVIVICGSQYTHSTNHEFSWFVPIPKSDSLIIMNNLKMQGGGGWL